MAVKKIKMEVNQEASPSLSGYEKAVRDDAGGIEGFYRRAMPRAHQIRKGRHKNQRPACSRNRAYRRMD